MPTCPIQNNGCYENPYGRRAQGQQIGISTGGLGSVTIGGEGTTRDREAIGKVSYGGDGNSAT